MTKARTIHKGLYITLMDDLVVAKTEPLENVEFNERAQTHKIGIDLRYAKAIKTTLTGDLQLILIDYNEIG